jgi:hypothetical protein
MWQEIEGLFNRALKFSYTRKKVFFLFPILLVCGLVIVLCHTLWIGSNPWVRASLAFIPAFLCAGVFMASAVPLIRLYHDEVKEKPLSVNKTLRNSWPLIGGIASLTIPLLTAYLVLWFILGIFYLLKNIPSVGEMLGVVLSFGPFLLIFGSMVLSLINLVLLFFMPPWVALKSTMRWEMAEEVLKKIGQQPFYHLILLLLGLIPLVTVVGFLILAAALTGMTFIVTERTWTIALQWFFIMIPFAAILSPVIIFFFNFAAESFAFLQRRTKK